MNKKLYFWFFLTLTTIVSAQTIQENMYVANDNVNVILPVGNTIYIGGTFNQLSKSSGHGVPVSSITGLAPMDFAKVSDNVRAVEPDGNGGWFIGGDFEFINGESRAFIAHINSDLSFDETWTPEGNYRVEALHLSGNKLYVGGTFQQFGGEPRSRLAALNAQTGELLEWIPNPDNQVLSIVEADGLIYIAGTFVSVDSQTRLRLAAVDTSDGLVTSWQPNANGRVRVIKADDTYLYAGGDFTQIGDSVRNHLARFSLSTGELDNWNPNVEDDIYGLAISENEIYIGGIFNNVGGQQRPKIAAISKITGLPTIWNPDCDDWILDLEISGNTLFAVGRFETIAGERRYNAASFNTITGDLNNWQPVTNNTVQTVGISEDFIFLGGNLTGIDGVERFLLAALDATSGDPLEWNPQIDDNAYGLSVNSLAYYENTIYAGGYFNLASGLVRNNLAAFDASSGELLTEWDTGTNSGTAGVVRTLDIKDSLLYVGGNFTQIGGESRNRIAAIGTQSAAVTNWDPDLNNYVTKMQISGNSVFIGGNFTTVGDSSRRYLAELNLLTGNTTHWNPSPTHSIADLIVHGNSVFPIGQYSTIGGQDRRNIADIDIFTGLVRDLNLTVNSGRIVSRAAAENGLVYIGGGFSQVNSDIRISLAAVDSATGNVIDWQAAARMNNGIVPGINDIKISNGIIYVGGNFSTINNETRSHFVAIGPDIQTALNNQQKQNSPVNYNLYQNFPNPFNPSTTISFSLPISQKVDISIYNTLGQKIETLLSREMKSGQNEIIFNAGHLTSGIYFYKIVAGDFVETKKMLLLK